jgi:adenine deaminase
MQAPASTLHEWIRRLPKAELHLHLEGSLEPEMMFAFAERNQVKLPFKHVDDVRAAYRFEGLDDFLALYYKGMSVLRTEADFYDLTLAYMRRAANDGVRHAEVFFDPQAHTSRGVGFDTVIAGIVSGLEEARQALGTTSRLILCFLRDLPESDAFATLESAKPHLAHLTAIGLDSSELGHPPSKFRRVYDHARSLELRLVAHAGEVGPPGYVYEALDILKVDRIDHGNRALEDASLVERLRASQMTLTVCPLSNLKLGGVADLTNHPLKAMLDLGLCATVNSDDPAYFGGYIHDNFVAAVDNLAMERAQIVTLAKNSFRGSFLDADSIARHLAEIERCE